MSILGKSLFISLVKHRHWRRRDSSENSRSGKHCHVEVLRSEAGKLRPCAGPRGWRATAEARVCPSSGQPGSSSSQELTPSRVRRATQPSRTTEGQRKKPEALGEQLRSAPLRLNATSPSCVLSKSLGPSFWSRVYQVRKVLSSVSGSRMAPRRFLIKNIKCPVAVFTGREAGSISGSNKNKENYSKSGSGSLGALLCRMLHVFPWAILSIVL